MVGQDKKRKKTLVKRWKSQVSGVTSIEFSASKKKAKLKIARTKNLRVRLKDLKHLGSRTLLKVKKGTVLVP